MDVNYSEYLKSDEWKEIRKLALFRANHKCQLCSAVKGLEVHHNSYEHLGNEAEYLEDLVVLCQEHHQMFHGTNKKEELAITSLGEVLIYTLEDIENNYKGATTSNLPCNYYDLDAMTTGFRPSDLTILASRPGMGKTSFALNITHNIAALHQLSVAFFSLEMSKEQLVERLLSSESQIESQRLRTGRITQNEWEPLSRAIGELSEMPIFIDDNPYTSVGRIRSQCKKIQAAQGAVGLVVIDYLQLMSAKGENRYSELSNITRSLKLLARELNVPIILLSQVNRGVESRTNKRPMLADLRDSGSSEEDADVVLMLYRDSYYNPDSPDRNFTELIVAKNRTGPTGTVRLLFDPNYTKFVNLARSNNY